MDTYICIPMANIHITTSLEPLLYQKACNEGFGRKASVSTGRVLKWSQALKVGVLVLLGERPNKIQELQDENKHLTDNIAKLQDRITWQARRIEELEIKQNGTTGM